MEVQAVCCRSVWEEGSLDGGVGVRGEKCRRRRPAQAGHRPAVSAFALVGQGEPGKGQAGRAAGRSIRTPS